MLGQISPINYTGLLHFVGGHPENNYEKTDYFYR